MRALCLSMNWSPPTPDQLATIPGPRVTGFAVSDLAVTAAADAWRTLKSVWWALALPWLVFSGVSLAAVNYISKDPAVAQLESALNDFQEINANGATESQIEELADTIGSIDYSGLFVKILAWGIPLALAYVAIVSFTTTVVALETRRLRGERDGIRRDSLRAALGRTPSMVLAYLYVIALPVVLISLAAAITALTGNFALTALSILVGLPLGLWWVVRNSLVGVSVATSAGFAEPAGKASRAVKGRWWAVAVRLFLTSLSLLMVSAIVAILVQIGTLAVASGLLVLLLAQRLLTTLIGATWTASVQLAMLDALARENGSN